MNRELLIAIIENVKINITIDLKEYNHLYLKDVRFESWEHSQDKEIRKSPYSWVAHSNSTQCYRTIFPMKNSSYVSFFKTLKGAKRNFIKRYLKGAIQ